MGAPTNTRSTFTVRRLRHARCTVRIRSASDDRVVRVGNEVFSTNAGTAHLDGVDVHLERRHFPVGQRPDVDHVQLGRRPCALVAPARRAERDNGVAVGDDLVDADREVVADLAEAHEHAVDDGLRADVGARQRVPGGLRPRDGRRHLCQHTSDVALGEAGVGVLDDFFVRGHLGPLSVGVV